MSLYSERHPFRDCANVTSDVYSGGTDSAPIEKQDGGVSSVSPDDSRQTLREMQQACTAMVQREAENSFLLMEDAVRVRAPCCLLSSPVLRSPALGRCMRPLRPDVGTLYIGG